jgi:hypothetical protein
MLRCVVLAIAAAFGFAAPRASAETAYFLCSGRVDIFDNVRYTHVAPQSFVVPVSAPDQIASVREFLARRARGEEPRGMYFRLRLALGGDGVNRNYAAPGAPAWDWRVAEVLSAARLAGNAIDASYQPMRDADPSDMMRFLRGELGPFQSGPITPENPRPPILPPNPPPTEVNLIYYPVQMELTTPVRSTLAHVSTRGFVGTGDRVLIVGFTVEGSAPRNVIVRALGPTLRALGVSEALPDPRLEIMRGNARVGENDSWVNSSLNAAYPDARAPVPGSAFAPTDAREPGLQLSLEPGNYTAIVRSADAQSGIALLEIFGLDPTP